MTVVERDHWFLYCYGIVEYCDGSLCIKVNFRKPACFGCSSRMSISKSYYVDHHNKLSKEQNVVVLGHRDRNGTFDGYAVYDERSSEWKEIIEQEESANLNKRNMTRK